MKLSLLILRLGSIKKPALRPVKKKEGRVREDPASMKKKKIYVKSSSNISASYYKAYI